MIVFVTTAKHGYTHEQVARQAAGFEVGVTNYESLLRQQRFSKATYVFTDMDRLSPSSLEAAALCFRRLQSCGMRVLNDPAQFHTRTGLLRRLHTLGINRFNAYRVEEHCEPQRWPVFVRTEGDHRHPVSDLLHTPQELAAAIQQAMNQGVPRSALIIVEYAGEPVRPGLFRKLSVFRIGAGSVAYLCAHDDRWLVKYGKTGIAPEELYRDELRIVSDNPYWPDLQRAFEIAAIDYGRVDFGLVGGSVQVYEINTNPQLKFPTEHPSAFRLDSYRVFKANYFTALRALDSTARNPVARPAAVRVGGHVGR
jgi:hypothetical protein